MIFKLIKISKHINRTINADQTKNWQKQKLTNELLQKMENTKSIFDKKYKSKENEKIVWIYEYMNLKSRFCQELTWEWGSWPAHLLLDKSVNQCKFYFRRLGYWIFCHSCCFPVTKLCPTLFANTEYVFWNLKHVLTCSRWWPKQMCFHIYQNLIEELENT